MKQFFIGAAKLLSLVFLLGATGIGYLTYIEKQDSRLTSEKVVEFAEENLTSKDGAYWFMKQNILNGKMDPVILIFGYYDNWDICTFMLDYAKETSPENKFECRSAP